MDEPPGLPLFSRVPDETALLDTTRCPACFTPLTSTRCTRCGLDLAAEGANGVYAASEAVVRALRVRDAAIAAMRAAQEERERAAESVQTDAAPAASAEPPAPPVAVPAADPLPTSAAPPVSPPVADHSSPAGPPRPRRSGVQIALLVAGVVAVSVAAIFFALVAVLLATPQVRAAILGGGALAVLGLAVALRRRLPATAEGVAVAGLVMLLFDLLLVRSAFGLEQVDGALYTGLGLLATAAVGVALGIPFRLRAGTLAGAVLAPLGVALAVTGALQGLDGTLRTWLGLLAALLVGGVGLVVRGRPESVALRVQGLLAALAVVPVSVFVPVATPALHLLTVGAATAVSAVWTLGAWRLRPAGAVTDLHLAPAVGGVAAVLAIGTALPGVLGPVALLPVLAVVPTAAIVVASRRRGPSHTAATATAVIAGVTAIGCAGGAFAELATVLAGPLAGLWGPLFDAGTRWAAAGPVVDVGAGTAGLAVVLVAAAIAVRRRGPVTGAAVVVALGALATAAASGTASVLLPVAVVVGAACVAALARLGDRDARAVAAVPTLGVALAVIALLSLRGVDLWPIAAAAGVGLTAAFRIASRSALRAALASGSFVAALVLVASTVAPWARASGLALLEGQSPAAAPFVVAGVVLLIVALRGRRIARLERAAVEGVAALTLLVAGAALTADGRGAATAATIGLAAAAAASIVWVGRSTSRGEPVLAAIAGPPLLAAAAMTLGFAIDRGPQVVPPLVPALGAVAVLGAAVLTLTRVREPLRDAWEVALAVAAFGVLAPLGAAPAPEWTAPLLVTAAAGAVLAFGHGDVFRAPLRHRVAGWIAIVLVLAAIWRALADRGVQDVEPYTLPAAAALLAVAFAATVRDAAASSRSGFAVAGAALALIPSAVATLGGPGPRGVVVAIIAAAMTTLSLVAPARWRGLAVAVPLAVLGAPVLAFVAATEGGRLVPGIGGPDVWVLPAITLLLGVGLLHLREIGPRVLAAVPLVSGSVLAALVGADAVWLREGVDLRVVIALLLLGAAHVVAVRLAAPAPTMPPAAMVPAVAGAVVVIAAVLTRFGTDRPLEVATVPFAVGLLAAGLVRLARDPQIRSWPALGPGLAVLLIPSLALDTAPAVVWRVVGVGVVAVAVFVWGAARQLSAPFVLGGGVFVVHVLVQLWPWIQQVYLAVWWLWIGLAGVLLIAVAARYEQRVRDLRQAARLLSAQR